MRFCRARLWPPWPASAAYAACSAGLGHLSPLVAAAHRQPVKCLKQSARRQTPPSAVWCGCPYLPEGRTLHYDVEGRHGAGKVFLRAASAGTGIIGGGPMRAVFETLGMQDVVAKSIGSSNPYNMVRGVVFLVVEFVVAKSAIFVTRRRRHRCHAGAPRYVGNQTRLVP